MAWAAMSEAELEKCVQELCADLGILRFHVRDARGMRAGFPDDVLLGRRGMLWRELKTDNGNLTSEQRRMGYALQAVGADWGVWRPHHWRTGLIRKELEAIK